MILHLDLDCFFVSAHRIDNQKYRNIACAVGGRSNLNLFKKENSKKQYSDIKGAFTSSILSANDDVSFEEYFVDSKGHTRGIITTSSYEARAQGVKTAMSIAEALRHCPTLKVIPSNYPLYHELSKKLNTLLSKEIPLLEQPSIDEFFGDVSGWIDNEDCLTFAIKLKQKILDELGLPISIGIAKTKWIAKLCTNHAKPFGIKQVNPDEVDEFIKNIPIKAFPGIGNALQNKLKKYYISTLGDIKNKKDLFYSWGKSGKQIYDRVCGIDHEKITQKTTSKSSGLSRTFEPILDRDEVKRRLIIICRHLSFIALKNKHKPMSFSLKVKYQYGEISKKTINTNRIFSEQYLKNEIAKLFNNIDIHPHHLITQITVTLSNFAETKLIALDMFNFQEDKKQEIIAKSIQMLRDKYGVDIIKTGGEL
jgi:DNA polymerase-4